MNGLLIDEIVKEVLDRLQQSERLKSSSPVLVVHPHTTASNSSVKELERYFSLMEINCNSPQSLKISNDVKWAIMLEADQSLIVKGALCLTDCAPSKLLAQLIMQNMPIFIVPEEEAKLFLEEQDMKSRFVNNNYFRQLMKYKEKLSEYGVAICTIQEVLKQKIQVIQYDQANSYSKKLITESVIENWEKRDIHILSNTIVTPLARDLAKQKGIEIKVEEES
ncbi:hypothetical protein [Psychrobacillus soli]|uniref:Ethanolamine utilization protein n=1 Tax=Psychrobacillus soli TaxID=1543965 RepID=A0A544SU57_9BACI|nr:hypothetical protein [Psychrobacillus soli]TQR08739.1 hypothetical protein FG383_16435 [Psychrobacillus soli]